MSVFGQKYSLKLIILLSFLKTTVSSVENLPMAQDTERGKYQAIGTSPTCDEFPIDYDPKTNTFSDNPKYTGGCKKFKITVSQDYEGFKMESYEETTTIKIGI